MRNFFIGFILLFLTACVPAVSSETVSLDRISANPTLSLNNEEVALITYNIGREQEDYIRKNLSKIKYLILNSPGGDMQFAYNIALMVKYSNIITIIPKNGVCESACTIIFQAAKERHASKSSSLMYHGVSIDIKVMDAYFKECPSVTKQCLQVFNRLKDLVKQETIRMYHVLEDYGLKHDVFLLLIKQPVDPNWLRTGNLTGYSEIRFTAEESMQHNAVTHIKEYDIRE
ncbi:hypothetical protein LCGC14_2007990 [marine sediment metagenome]|uniref:ATP-dependent Clp protease proteolytic subunit n=1 Tax=marine sediment metagenome TaxID=412755 RepID=A0A0F9F134_9ZZZZ